MMILELLALGLVAGLIRGAVGVSKNVYAKKEIFDLPKLVYMLLVASIAGAVAALIAGGDWRSALLFGYAGVDFFEGVYKTMILTDFKSDNQQS